ncbi:hypothetical protein M422DRAFT_273853 [Sphaerobolus stellatus SS14]|uniref:F-box domain-containing protein n=1 Tax=Sphaerobolus stellatus (strain SS14) TaxID=990650 RepID=A0A0C9U809_SPHS4|nr:hypothetical protein M422DRAFT_273853 [Sphaerobolus stellatus SS14]
MLGEDDFGEMEIGHLLRSLASAPTLHGLNLNFLERIPVLSGPIPLLSGITHLVIRGTLVGENLALFVKVFPKLTTLTVDDTACDDFSDQIADFGHPTANPLASIADGLEHLTLIEVPSWTDLTIRKVITTPMQALRTFKLRYIASFQKCFMPKLTASFIKTEELMPPEALVDLVLAEKLPSIRTISIDAKFDAGDPEEQRIRNRIEIVILKLAFKDVSLSYNLVDADSF